MQARPVGFSPDGPHPLLDLNVVMGHVELAHLASRQVLVLFQERSDSLVEGRVDALIGHRRHGGSLLIILLLGGLPFSGLSLWEDHGVPQGSRSWADRFDEIDFLTRGLQNALGQRFEGSIAGIQDALGVMLRHVHRRIGLVRKYDPKLLQVLGLKEGIVYAQPLFGNMDRPLLKEADTGRVGSPVDRLHAPE